jgi:hypothetical protein
MPRVVVVAVSLVSVSAWAAAAGPWNSWAPAGSTIRVVRLAWTDPASATVSSGARASEETVRVLAALGLRAVSRPALPSELTRPDEIRVVLLPGPPPPRAGRTVLGAAATNGRPNVWVYSDGVARLLGARVPFRPMATPIDDVIRFDLAAGRVVAHEVVHLLAPGGSRTGRG